MKLRALAVQDIPYILEWMQDPEIAQFFRFDPKQITKETVDDFIRSANQSVNDLHYAIVDEDDEYLGTVSLKSIDYISKNAEYAIALRKKSMGTNVGIQAGQWMLKEAFTVLNLERVYLNVLSSNGRSIRYCEKLGFAYEGEFKNHLMLHGKLESLKWYAMLKEQYYV